MGDFVKMLKSEDLYDPNQHNISNHTYNIGKSKIEFFGAEDSSKLRGARRDVLFVNECNNISYDTFRELEVRTKKQIFLDYNPVSAFWVHDKILTLPDSDRVLITSTYKDNDFLDENIIRSIESKKNDTEWYNVYALGLVGSNEGLVFKQFELVDDMPTEFQWECYGLDWGFSHDPTGVIRVCLSNGELFLDEQLYLTGLTNKDIIDRVQHVKPYEIVADSAEPKSIEDMRRAGFDIRPAIKGPDSVRSGIDAVRSYKLNVTKRSVNLIKELRNYRYKKSNDGGYVNDPHDSFNHLLDPLRYVVSSKSSRTHGSYDYSVVFV